MVNGDGTIDSTQRKQGQVPLPLLGLPVLQILMHGSNIALNMAGVMYSYRISATKAYITYFDLCTLLGHKVFRRLFSGGIYKKWSFFTTSNPE